MICFLKPQSRFILAANVAFASCNRRSAFGGHDCVSSDEKGLNIQLLESRTGWTDIQIVKALGDPAELGVRWLQPTSRAHWNFAFPDDIVARARRRCIQLLIQIVVPNPGWAVEEPQDLSALPTTRIADFASFTGAMAARYAPLAVLIGSLVPRDSMSLEGPVEFMRRLYDLGFKAYFDGVASHPYTSDARQDPPCTMNDASPRVRSVMIDHGDPPKKIWIVESGFPTGSEPSPQMTKSMQAQWISNVYAGAANTDWRDERSPKIGAGNSRMACQATQHSKGGE